MPDRKPSTIAWIVLAIGALLMVAGVVWGIFAPTINGTFVGLTIEIVGVLVLIPGLHGVIDG